MSNIEASLHLYQRAVDGDRDDSLSVIAQLIESGQTLLDLGMGTGGLAHYLSQHQTIVADGVTLNQVEADIARAWYRQAVVADLDHTPLDTLFGEQRYDCIVCADVLEHLKAPQDLLRQCKALLAPGGRLITSIPNTGYCGLVAELIEGDFRYRPEGLLDQTHLRFFTRRSLQRFFDEQGWVVQTISDIKRSLLESEFQVAFDGLPPAVARHLLAAPDALIYQFVHVLQPIESVVQFVAKPASNQPTPYEKATPAHALFSAELYLAVENQYDEARKLVTAGRIGEARQTLCFDIPSSPKGYSHIRIDPADRPGFFRLHHLRIRLPEGESIWQWQAEADPLVTLANALHNDMLFASPWEMAAGALLLLYGSDPWIELPLAPSLMAAVALNGATLEVGAGWPMSADYLQASTTISQLQATHQQTWARLDQEVGRLSQQLTMTESSRLALEAQLDVSRQAAFLAQTEKQQLIDELGTVNSSQRELQDRISALNEIGRASQDENRVLIEQVNSVERERHALAEQFSQLNLQLQEIESSTVFRVTRPLVHLKMAIDQLRNRVPTQDRLTQSKVLNQRLPIPNAPVDIIVPVYRGLEDTRRCLESVLAAPCRCDWRLIIINDCTPEPELTRWLGGFVQRDPRITLLENTENIGFVATVNRGMALSEHNDVLLLNSDTEVANDWLDRLQRAAYSAPRVASVTPFSNNATICSYPRFCQANQLPGGQDTESLDRLFAKHLAGQTLEIPTGIGFCMYLRRECLQQIGQFDVANFGQGYGEENDFCVRAQEVGWTHLHALDIFVRHVGGTSFGDSKSERERQAMETLRRLHPRYESDVQAFVQRDPARRARLTIDIARITASARPVILNVTHNREGGTLRHIQELAQQLSDQATFLRLAPAPGGVEMRLEGVHEAFALHFALPQERASLLQTLRLLQVGHIHYHHLLDHAPEICELPTHLGVSHDFTAHDYYSYCPQISLTDHNDRYCGEQGIEQCHDCLQRQPAPGGETIESWHARHARLLSQARYVITPSFDAAVRMQRFVPAAHIQVLPHASLYARQVQYPQPHPRILTGRQRLKIVVLGALSRIKGADTLEEVATLTAIQNLDIEFHLIGYPYRSLRALPRSLLTVHGGYEEKDLPQLLQALQADAVWFPALWPETYSYTLSAALEAGLPIIAPNLGAFAERLQDRDWTWLCNWYQGAAQWLEFFDAIRTEYFCRGTSPGHIATFTPPTLQDGATDPPVLSYRSNYLTHLPLRSNASARERHELELAATFKQRPGINTQATAAIKLAALRTLMRLHTYSAFSPLKKLVPMHLQRRVKSWLGK